MCIRDRISPEGIGFIGMILNLFSATLVASFTTKTPADVKEMVDNIRQP